MEGIGRPQLHTKFEVASFSRWTNIKGEPLEFLVAPIAQGHVHFFSDVGFYDGLWKIPAAGQL